MLTVIRKLRIKLIWYKRRYELRDYEQESVSEARELRDYERINEKVYGSNWVNVFDEFMG